MRLGNLVLLLWLTSLLLGFPGCETAGKKAVLVVPPVRYIPPPLPANPPPEPVTGKVAEASPAIPQPDPAQELTVHSEAAYQAGVAAYESGHLERAKREFDQAVDLLLEAPTELGGDARLEKHFEQLVDNIHNYELVALKEGDGFTEQRWVPAPVDEIADLTFPSDNPSLKEKVQREVQETGSDLPLVINKHVLGYINYFSTRGKGGLETTLQRAGRYRGMISRILREEGVPQDLIYLAQAESAFQPWAVSRSGARGLWQFMRSRGREYGLDSNWWVDERQDPEKSTRAAARHLKDLYQAFGDWYLAMAAYNSGPARVRRAIQRTGYADFWELLERNVLPRETRNYVPIILATTIVAKNPEKYGLDRVAPELPLEVETVAISTPTDLRLIAETIDCSVNLLQTLNPSLLRLVTPKGEFELKLPAGTKRRFLEQIAQIPENKRVFWRWHRVTPGESLGRIARRYKTTVAAITKVNGLKVKAPLPVNAKLVIPVTSRRAGHPGRVRLRYRIRWGDTLSGLAKRFGVSISNLRRWNRIRGSRLIAGRFLVIYARQSKPVKAVSRARSSSKARSKASRRSAANRKIIFRLAKSGGSLTNTSLDR